MFENVKTIFFDFDGCLHDSTKIFLPAFSKAYDYLVKLGQVPDKEWNEEEVSHKLGFNCFDIWNGVAPNAEKAMIDQCVEIVSQEQNRLIRTNQAVLFDGAIDTLKYLKNKGYKLVFVSNCRTYYKEAHAKVFGLDDIFSEMACAQDYDNIPKHEIVKNIMPRYEMDMVMIGDRFHDIDAGKKNGILTIGSLQGYSLPNELDSANVCIEKITDLKRIL